MHDMIKKGRAADTRGEGNGYSILTEQDVREIRVMLGQKVPQWVIAKKYGVSRQLISQINMGEIWGWLK